MTPMLNHCVNCDKPLKKGDTGLCESCEEDNQEESVVLGED